MSRRKPAPNLTRGGHRFADKDMRNFKVSAQSSGMISMRSNRVTLSALVHNAIFPAPVIVRSLAE
jgi:hypothetical protein